MARINFEDSVFTTPQWNKLIVSIAKKYAHCDLDEFQELAKGRLHTIWRLAQDYWIENRTLIPEKVWILIPYHQDMIDCGFAEKRESGIYIYGSEEQFEWLISRRESGRKGGLKRQANLKKRDEANSSNAILDQKEANSELDDVPWPGEQDEKLSTIQDDTIYQIGDLSTFDQYDHGYQNQNPSNAKAKPSNAKANSSKSKPPTPTLSPPPPSSLNFSKKEKEEKLIEASTNFVYEEKTSAIDEHFDNACQKYREKFEHRVDWKINAGQNAKLRYSQLIKSGVNHDQVLDMINNYADAKFTRYPNRDGFFSIHQTFERFLGFPGDWHCKKYLTPIVIVDRSKLERNTQSKVRADIEEEARLERAAEKKAKRLFRLGYNLEEKKIINDRIENEKRMKQEGESKRKPVDLSGTDFKTAGDILNGMNFKF